MVEAAGESDLLKRVGRASSRLVMLSVVTIPTRRRALGGVGVAVGIAVYMVRFGVFGGDDLKCFCGCTVKWFTRMV